MDRFWVFLDHRMKGPVDITTLLKLPGFHADTQICREGDPAWRPASQDQLVKNALLQKKSSVAVADTKTSPLARVHPTMLVGQARVFIRPSSTWLTQAKSRHSSRPSYFLLGFLLLNTAVYSGLYKMLCKTGLKNPAAAVSMLTSNLKKPEILPSATVHRIAHDIGAARRKRQHAQKIASAQ